MIVKICGITQLANLREVSKTGCDWIGFVVGFPKSPRNLSLENLIELVAHTPEPVEPVVVCPSSNVNLVEEIVSKATPYALQLYGDEKPRVKGVKLIKAIKVTEELTITKALEISEGYDFMLLDSPSPGSGKTHNWEKSRAIREASPIPVILSGGLNPSNVVDAIKIVLPHGVDVSSGVEKTPGVKDITKVLTFTKLAKRL